MPVSIVIAYTFARRTNGQKSTQCAHALKRILQLGNHFFALLFCIPAARDGLVQLLVYLDELLLGPLLYQFLKVLAMFSSIL